jgi:hypothetical protein
VNLFQIYERFLITKEESKKNDELFFKRLLSGNLTMAKWEKIKEKSSCFFLNFCSALAQFLAQGRSCFCPLLVEIHLNTVIKGIYDFILLPFVS